MMEDNEIDVVLDEKKEERGKKQKVNYNTPFHTKIVELLKESGIVKPITDRVAIYTENDSDEAIVEYNCMSTGIKLNKKDVNKADTENAGFHWWPTWNWGTK